MCEHCEYDDEAGGFDFEMHRLPLKCVRAVDRESLFAWADGVVFHMAEGRVTMGAGLDWVERFMASGSLATLLLTEDGEPVSLLRLKKSRDGYKEFSMGDLPECRECGACCGLPKWFDVAVDLAEEDIDRMSPKTREALVASLSINGGGGMAIPAIWSKQKSGPFEGREVRVCQFLEGSLLHKCSCSIYEERPEPCRQFRRGSKECWASILEWRMLANMPC